MCILYIYIQDRPHCHFRATQHELVPVVKYRSSPKPGLRLFCRGSFMLVSPNSADLLWLQALSFLAWCPCAFLAPTPRAHGSNHAPFSGAPAGRGRTVWRLQRRSELMEETRMLRETLGSLTKDWRKSGPEIGSEVVLFSCCFCGCIDWRFNSSFVLAEW